MTLDCFPIDPLKLEYLKVALVPLKVVLGCATHWLIAHYWRLPQKQA